MKMINAQCPVAMSFRGNEELPVLKSLDVEESGSVAVVCGVAPICIIWLVFHLMVLLLCDDEYAAACNT